MFSSAKSLKFFPLTRCTTRERRKYPESLYCQSVPGGKFNALCRKMNWSASSSSMTSSFSIPANDYNAP